MYKNLVPEKQQLTYKPPDLTLKTSPIFSKET
jgi:hypothetical protein